MPEKTILLIEDDTVYANFLSERLEVKGYCVHIGTSIKEGEFLIGKFPRSLIILDIYFPDGEGWKLAESLFGPQDLSRVIVNTAHLNNNIQRKAKKLGIPFVLDKSSPPDHLIQTVKTAWEHNFESS